MVGSNEILSPTAPSKPAKSRCPCSLLFPSSWLFFIARAKAPEKDITLFDLVGQMLILLIVSEIIFNLL